MIIHNPYEEDIPDITYSISNKYDLNTFDYVATVVSFIIILVIIIMLVLSASHCHC